MFAASRATRDGLLRFDAIVVAPVGRSLPPHAWQKRPARTIRTACAAYLTEGTWPTKGDRSTARSLEGSTSQWLANSDYRPANPVALRGWPVFLDGGAADPRSMEWPVRK